MFLVHLISSEIKFKLQYYKKVLIYLENDGLNRVCGLQEQSNERS